MSKHPGYDLVRPMFKSGNLKTFSDIFNFDLVPKSTVATDLGKEKGRFNQLIKNPDGFNFQEIRQFSALCDMTPSEMGALIESEHPRSPAADLEQKENKYGAFKPMVEEKRITLLEEIFKYITRSQMARKIGRKPNTLDRYLKNVGLFTIKDIRAIGGLFDLSLPDMLRLVEAQYAKQNNTPPL
jgi:hypothetical protein